VNPLRGGLADGGGLVPVTRDPPQVRRGLVDVRSGPQPAPRPPFVAVLFQTGRPHGQHQARGLVADVFLAVRRQRDDREPGRHRLDHRQPEALAAQR
jgi:hypothetical protein